VGSKAEAAAAAEVVSRLDTDVELLALEEQGGWWEPVVQVAGTAVQQAQHELDRGAGLVLLGIAVGTQVVLLVSALVLDMEAALEQLDSVVGSAGVAEVLLLAQVWDMAATWPLADWVARVVVGKLDLSLSQHMVELTQAELLFVVGRRVVA